MTLTTVEVHPHVAILQEVIRANVHQEEDDMRTTAETMEEGAPHHHEDDWMMDMDMDHHLHDEHLMIMIRMNGEVHLHQVVILTHIEAEIHMLDQEVHHQDMGAGMAGMRMVHIQDDIGKSSNFRLLTDYLKSVSHGESPAHFLFARTVDCHVLFGAVTTTWWNIADEIAAGCREMFVCSKIAWFTLTSRMLGQEVASGSWRRACARHHKKELSRLWFVTKQHLDFG